MSADERLTPEDRALMARIADEVRASGPRCYRVARKGGGLVVEEMSRWDLGMPDLREPTAQPSIAEALTIFRSWVEGDLERAKREIRLCQSDLEWVEEAMRGGVTVVQRERG